MNPKIIEPIVKGKLFKYRKIIKLDPKKDNVYQVLKKEAFKNNSVIVDINNFEFVSFEKPKQSSNVEEIYFSNLTYERQEELLSLFLKKKVYEYKKLSTYFEELNLNSEHSNKYIIKRFFQIKPLLLNNNLFLSIDIKHKIESKKDLFQIYKEYKEYFTKEILIGRKVKGIKNSGGVGEIVNVIFPDDKEHSFKLEEISNYVDISKFPEFDKQPIVEVRYETSPKIYPYLSSDLKFSYTISQIKENILELKISNTEREKLIRNFIKKNNLSKFVSPYPLRISSVEFKDINLISKYGKGTQPKKFFKLKNSKLSIFPLRVPHIFKNFTIPIILIYDFKVVKNKSLIESFIKKLENIDTTFQRFKFITSIPIEDLKIDKVDKLIHLLNNLKIDRNLPPLVIIVGSKKIANKGEDYYQDLKRRLFQIGYISQNILYENLVKNRGKLYNFEELNLILQIMCKYGMYPYSIELDTEFDYILGVDVGNDIYGNRNIGGGISIINNKGIFEKLIPLEIKTGGERIDFKYILEGIANLVNLENKKLLILRDGKLFEKEIITAKDKIKYLGIEKITFINIIKKHNFRIFDDTIGRKGVILRKNLALVLAHKIQGAQPIKVDNKVVIKNDNFIESPLDAYDLNLLYKLTGLNYSNLFLKSERLRLPAPIHYSDKFVKAKGKGWETNELLLRNGCLYFL